MIVSIITNRESQWNRTVDDRKKIVIRLARASNPFRTHRGTLVHRPVLRARGSKRSRDRLSPPSDHRMHRSIIIGRMVNCPSRSVRVLPIYSVRFMERSGKRARQLSPVPFPSVLPMKDFFFFPFFFLLGKRSDAHRDR